MLYFSPDTISRLVLDIDAGRSSHFEFARPVFERSSVHAFELCYAALTAENTSALAAESRMIMLLSGFLRGSRRVKPAPSLELVRVRHQIDSDPTAPLSLDDLAKEAGLSRYQTLRGFAKLTGLPPHTYQVQRRLEAARRLIGRGVSVSEAAAASGFADQSHLHRMFVRRFGFTPGAYAAAMR